MLCSKCSEVVRPVVALDIDGTLGDYHHHFLNFAVDWLGIASFEAGDELLYDGSESFKDWFTNAFSVDVTTFRMIKLAYRQGGQKRSMPAFPFATQFVNSLAPRAEVWFTTTRPHDRYDRVDPDTREWLRRQGMRWDDLLFSDRKMEELAGRVEPERVAFVLDDLPETLERAERLFPNAVTVLRQSIWNRSRTWRVMLGDLLDARAVATAAVQSWELTHHFDDLPTTQE